MCVHRLVPALTFLILIQRRVCLTEGFHLCLLAVFGLSEIAYLNTNNSSWKQEERQVFGWPKKLVRGFSLRCYFLANPIQFLLFLFQQ